MTRQGAALPQRPQRIDQRINIGVAVQRAGGDTQPFCAFGHGRIVDRLHINAPIIHQDIADLAAFNRITDHYRNNMAVILQMRDTGCIKLCAQLCDPVALGKTFDIG